MTAPLFYVEPAALAADPVVLDGDEGRHAADVRRLRVGERIDVGDGAGHVVRGIVVEAGRGRLAVAVQGRDEVAAPVAPLVVVQALAKGGRDTDAVEAMTEVGVDEVVAWAAARSVARPTDRTAAKWAATARAAGKQSRRPWIPRVSGPLTTEQVAARLAQAVVAVVLHEDGDDRLVTVEPADVGETVLVVGPEGGLDPAEVELFRAAGARVCRIGDTVLRSSTAGVVALSMVAARRG